MTSQDNMPDDLARIEQLLMASRANPPAELRARVMSRVGRELAVSQKRDVVWSLAAAAAIVLLALNLSFSAAQTTWMDQTTVNQEQVQVVCDQIATLQLDISKKDAARMSVLMLSGQNLRPSGIPYGGPTQAAWLE